ncbi:hypothetical protein OS493_006813 [Desmophyllum pertusum]|uniref:Uncharacterized protein n=1 Tax=Desmophyllum pertusum TaxID=174260 RepID=A0A9X0D525_9CNID|nr:hypothetical protein OS493_006813 [Desmophyllum pertusum]
MQESAATPETSGSSCNKNNLEKTDSEDGAHKTSSIKQERKPGRLHRFLSTVSSVLTGCVPTTRQLDVPFSLKNPVHESKTIEDLRNLAELTTLNDEDRNVNQTISSVELNNGDLDNTDPGSDRLANDNDKHGGHSNANDMDNSRDSQKDATEHGQTSSSGSEHGQTCSSAGSEHGQTCSASAGSKHGQTSSSGSEHGQTSSSGSEPRRRAPSRKNTSTKVKRSLSWTQGIDSFWDGCTQFKREGLFSPGILRTTNHDLREQRLAEQQREKDEMNNSRDQQRDAAEHGQTSSSGSEPRRRAPSRKNTSTKVKRSLSWTQGIDSFWDGCTQFKREGLFSPGILRTTNHELREQKLAEQQREKDEMKRKEKEDEMRSNEDNDDEEYDTTSVFSYSSYDEGSIIPDDESTEDEDDPITEQTATEPLPKSASWPQGLDLFCDKPHTKADDGMMSCGILISTEREKRQRKEPGLKIRNDTLEYIVWRFYYAYEGD